MKKPTKASLRELRTPTPAPVRLETDLGDKPERSKPE